MASKLSLKAIAGMMVATSFAVMLAVIPSVKEEYQHFVLICSFVGLVLGIVLWVIGKIRPQQSKEDSPMSGDTYNNSGNNYGHMGPVHIGRQRFVFTPVIEQEILAKVPRNNPLPVWIVGSMSAQQVGHEIVNFLRANGYVVSEVNTAGMMSPPPSGPLTYDGQTITIAADL